MKHKFFSIPATNPTQAEEVLNHFCDQHRVVNIEKQFVADGTNSFWSLCVTWLAHEGALPNNLNVMSTHKRMQSNAPALWFSISHGTHGKHGNFLCLPCFPWLFFLGAK